MTMQDVRPTAPAAPAAAAQPIFSRQMGLLLMASFGALTSFYLLLSVVPLYAGTGAGGVGAGLSMGSMMLSTVLVELAVPRLVARFGYRIVMGAGLFLLGAPALALLASPAMPLVLGVCLARGAGLGIVVVAGTALAAELIPAERRGEGLGLYGAAVGIPSIVGLPVGLWLGERAGFASVFVIGALVSLVAMVAVLGLPSLRTPIDHPGGVLGGLRSGAIARPTLIFAAITLAVGVTVTFLPLAVSAGSAHLAAAALLVQSVVTPIARWWAGRFGDRHGSARLLVPGVVAAAAGTACLVWVDSPVAVIVGMALFGFGFGVGQNVTLALMFERVSRSEFSRVSALWNLAYDAGMGVGAVGFGFLVGHSGYPFAFAMTAAVLVVALVPALRDKRR